MTKFESMSNELLMKVFEYYDLYSLFSLFTSLNSRFDAFINRCQFYANLDCIKPINFVDFLVYILPRVNPCQIRSLHSSKSHQITLLAYDKSLVCFTHIRSLSLNEIPSSTVRYMVERIHFSRLERVLLNQCKGNWEDTWSFSEHFFNSNRYPFLKTYIDSNSMIGEGTSLLSIEHMTMSQLSCPSLFLNFLNRSPVLKYIRTQIEFGD
ncbi:unnamed protein product [Rotaria sp. Silwood2]|nr:unnamed protein product [Rotaria sp. Silwood2]CAF2928015.1 unnamed protein product [Rotaria sp. Silwood2]CAF3188969.1 unnamed protein product [Rotaria sp. Silwood2]CAF3313296.1 unnamed protein product [Rotaria sp. Silwood2]CAF3950362.1 unnamed protein product [Rotaria sp. Silwood2]